MRAVPKVWALSSSLGVEAAPAQLQFGCLRFELQSKGPGAIVYGVADEQGPVFGSPRNQAELFRVCIGTPCSWTPPISRDLLVSLNPKP